MKINNLTWLLFALVSHACFAGAAKILLIDADFASNDAIVRYFEREGVNLRVEESARHGLTTARVWLPDLIVMERRIPTTTEGDQLLSELSRGDKTRYIPVIFLTVAAEESDQLVGFALGCEDYVIKPYSVRVLYQRAMRVIKAVSRAAPISDPILSTGPFKIDSQRHTITQEGRVLEFTPTEYKLFECLVRGQGRAFTRAELIDTAIGNDAVVLDRTMDVHVKSMRKKIKNGDLFIETVRSVGYRFNSTPNL